MFDDIQTSVAAGLMELEHNIRPVLDSVDKMRAEFISRGWSAEGAERMAVAWFDSMANAGGAPDGS